MEQELNFPENNLLFRCSKLGDLMLGLNFITEIQKEKLAKLRAKESLTDNQKIELGELLAKEKLSKSDELSKTAKSAVEKIWWEENYGYKPILLTQAILKGRLLEQEAFKLVQKVLGGELRIAYKSILEMKGLKYLSNEFIKGVPDIVLNKEDYVDDTKCCENLETFLTAELDNSNYWQMVGYMDLTGKSKARVLKCLLKSTPEMITDAKSKYYYMFHYDEENADYQDISNQIEHNNNVIDQIPIEKRVKVFEIEKDPEKTALLYNQIRKARLYYSTLKM